MTYDSLLPLLCSMAQKRNLPIDRIIEEYQNHLASQLQDHPTRSFDLRCFYAERDLWKHWWPELPFFGILPSPAELPDPSSNVAETARLEAKIVVLNKREDYRKKQLQVLQLQLQHLTEDVRLMQAGEEKPFEQKASEMQRVLALSRALLQNTN